MKEFKVSSNADVGGTSLKGYIESNFKKMVELYGHPSESDGFKVSSEWVFESETGDVITVYDWKSTRLYDENLMSVEEFRALPEYRFHIGAHSAEAARDFKLWLTTQLAAHSS